MFRLMLREPWVYAAAIFLFLAMGSLIGTYAFTPVYVSTLHQQGLPLTPDELEQLFPDVSDDENGALFLLSALDQKTAASIDRTLIPVAGDARMPRPDEPIPLDMQRDILRAVEANDTCITLLYEALEYQQFLFPHGPMYSSVDSLDNLSKSREAMRWLYLDMLRHLINQNFREMTKPLLAQIHLSNILQQQYNTIFYLVSSGISGVFHEMLEQALCRVSFTEEELEEIMAALQEYSTYTVEGMSKAYQGELVYGLSLITDPLTFLANWMEMALNVDMEEENVQSVLDNIPDFWPAILAVRFSGLGLYARIPYIRMIKGYIDLYHLSQPEAMQEHQRIIDIVNKTLARSLFSLFPSSYFHGYFVCATNLARAVTAQAAVAIERYRLAHDGQLPETLDMLVPQYLDETPLDPFDGEPLRYRRYQDGYIVYSVGPNRVDDGGYVPVAEGEREKSDDIYLLIKRP